jgi:hypothetical protein
MLWGSGEASIIRRRPDDGVPPKMTQQNNPTVTAEPPVGHRRRSSQRSRTQRWRDAVAVLMAVQRECDAHLQTLPDHRQESDAAETLQAICDLDLSELEAIEPPRGSGRD